MESGRSRFEVGLLLSESSALAIRNWWRVAIALVVMCAVGVLIDLNAHGGSWNMLYSLVAIAFQVWLTDALLKQTGADGSGVRSSAIGVRVSFVTQLGIVFGLLLFVVPGVIAFVRWSMALPIALSKGTGVIESIKESWARSEGHFWPILVLLMLIYVPAFGGAIGLGIVVESATPLTADIVTNLLMVIGLILGWYVAVAIFLAGEPRTEALREVFA